MGRVFICLVASQISHCGLKRWYWKALKALDIFNYGTCPADLAKLDLLALQNPSPSTSRGPCCSQLGKFFLLTTFRFFSLGPLSSGKFTFGDPTRGDCPLTTELPGTQQFLHCVKVAKCCQEAFLQKMPARWRFNNGCPSNDKHKTAMKGISKPIGSASHSRKKNKKRKAWGMKNNRTNS